MRAEPESIANEGAHDGAGGAVLKKWSRHKQTTDGQDE
jgi:hypothetical protein